MSGWLSPSLFLSVVPLHPPVADGASPPLCGLQEYQRLVVFFCVRVCPDLVQFLPKMTFFAFFRGGVGTFIGRKGDLDLYLIGKGVQDTMASHPFHIKKAANWIKEAKQPLLCVGMGATPLETQKHVRDLAERGGIPVVTLSRAKGAFPLEHILYVGSLGLYGNYSANMALQKCDLLIACGVRPDLKVLSKLAKYMPKTRKILFDSQKKPARIEEKEEASLTLWGDLCGVLETLVQAVPRKSHLPWMRELDKWDQKGEKGAKMPVGVQPKE